MGRGRLRSRRDDEGVVGSSEGFAMGSRGREEEGGGDRSCGIGLAGTASGDMREGTGAESAISGFSGSSDLRSRCIGKRVSVRFISHHPSPAYGVISPCRACEGSEGSSKSGQIRGPRLLLTCVERGEGSLRNGRGRRTLGESEVGELVRGVTGERRRRQKTVEGVPIVECHEKPGDGPVATLLR